MKWLGYKQVPFKSITLDAADIRQRSKAAHVAELANDSREAGDEFIHAPTVRRDGNVLVCGRDRMAAALILKRKRVWVHLVDCDDREAKALERRENIYRRPVENRSEMLAELVELRTGEIEKDRELAGAEGGTVSPAPQHSAKAEARRQVARAAGISPASVKKAEQRAAAAARDSAPGGADAPVSATSQGEAPPAAEPTLDLLGVDDASTRAVCAFALTTQEAIDGADKHLRLALGALKPIEATALGQELRVQVERVGGLVRAARPAAVCPWCKGLPKATFGICGGCKGAQWVTAEHAARAPVEAREGKAGVTIVLWNGLPVPYADALAGKFPTNGAPAKKGPKHVRVEDEHGNEMSLDDEAAY
jgi:ParB-like chromosome segregation protein Spo0J